MSKIQLPVQLTGVQSKADRTWKLTFSTQELGAEAAEITALLMDVGWMIFSPNDDLTEEDVPEVKAEVGEGKTPSQRLRAVLHVFWVQKGKPGSWEQFYLAQTERLIETIKAKLED